MAGFSASDSIDLSQMFAANATLGYSENSSHTGGSLTVSDGTQMAKVALLGQYIAGSFVTAADGHGGTPVADATQVRRRRTSEEARRWIVEGERRCTRKGETSRTDEDRASRTGENGRGSLGQETRRGIVQSEKCRHLGQSRNIGESSLHRPRYW